MKNYVNLPKTELINLVISRNEAQLTNAGMIVADTGKHTGRAANDKFIVCDSVTENTVDWSTNKKMTPQAFSKLCFRVNEYLADKQIFINDLRAGVGADSLSFTLNTTTAWHSLFGQTMFYQDGSFSLGSWQIVHVPDFKAIPSLDQTNSDAFIVLNFTEKMVLIGGTHYAGEIKKSVFTVLNFLLPAKGTLPMHSSVNHSVNGDSAIFFGLSGTGKTTLSASSDRVLVGDDEHGWRLDGSIFNFEDGCYAKAIKLSQSGEPEIWDAVHQSGTVLENVSLVDGVCDFNSSAKTENTRAAYKLSNIKNSSKTRETGAASTIFMLACDAYGVLPPLSKLTPEQAAYYFLSGYTAKVAGTEAGVKEPTAAFSACFGAPFLPRHPTEYAHMLVDRIKEYGSHVWLVNTGWTGGPYGVGNRISLSDTRTLVNFALNQEFNKEHHYSEDLNFGFQYLSSLEGVDVRLLNPLFAWNTNNVQNFAEKAKELAAKFKDNFKKYEALVSPDILNAGPK